MIEDLLDKLENISINDEKYEQYLNLLLSNVHNMNINQLERTKKIMMKKIEKESLNFENERAK